MKELDLTPLKENDVQYEKAVSELESHFKCDWDDPVHDSYGHCVNQMREKASEIRVIRCKAETLQQEIEDLRIDEVIKTADNLCKEAEAV